MTTAVQPNELVFEFASNGMDEINQVRVTLETSCFKLFLNQTFCCFVVIMKTGLLVHFSGPIFDHPSFSTRRTVALCDLVDKR